MPRDEIRLAAPERVLQTRRLLLEPLTAAHAAELYENLLDRRLYTFIPRDPPTSGRALEDRYRRLSARRSPDGGEAWLNWAVRERETGRFVGALEATLEGDLTAFIAYTVFVSRTSGGASPLRAANGWSRTFSGVTEFRPSWPR